MELVIYSFTELPCFRLLASGKHSNKEIKLLLKLLAQPGVPQSIKTPWHESASELYRPTERLPLVGEVSAKFADRGCHVVSVTAEFSAF
jgi:hypothetical protein